MEKYIIRTATIEDLNPLVLLFDAYRIFYRKASDIASAKAFLQERLEQKDSVIYVAEASATNTLVGFTQLYPLFSSTRMKRQWLLNDLYVDQAHRGKGLSKRLIERSKALAQATKAAGVRLETEKSNTIGNKLYPKTGFELDTEHNHYYYSLDS